MKSVIRRFFQKGNTGSEMTFIIVVCIIFTVAGSKDFLTQLELHPVKSPIRLTGVLCRNLLMGYKLALTNYTINKGRSVRLEVRTVGK
jgi:hypothetical protein